MVVPTDRGTVLTGTHEPLKNKTFTGERQCMFVSLLHNGASAFVNQYGRVESVSDLGSFDFDVSGTQGRLLFYPTKY